ncbi:cell cycle progression protein 1 isoform X2 [Protopterus annectens]|uniref:cell cycle progression protein 1 isoform X2 n=1 Tax=Protopterus annectens TaxID=7888 RepID=UPI001CFB0CF6|nr:cell cycle progression protein 1 isoform X2 [Protopterus annectens]
MSANSSDSEGSSGWTIINNEGSDTETLGYENGGVEHDQSVSEGPPPQKEEETADGSLELKTEDNSVAGSSIEVIPVPVISDIEATPEVHEEKLDFESSVCACAASDDSDIVTLESLPVEEIGQQECESPVEEIVGLDEYNLGSSSSSQYNFSAPKIAFTSEISADESSSDESTDKPCSSVRKRRLRSSVESSTETEVRPDGEHEVQQQRQQQGQFSSTLNKCILIALVVAISMGFGHFYGTTQIKERQRLFEKIRTLQISDVKDDVFEEDNEGSKSHTEDLEVRLKQTEVEKQSLESQQQGLKLDNQQLKNSLELEERALSSLQEELRKLREQIRILESKGAGTESILAENQKLKDHLEEEKQRIWNFVNQKETLVAEAQMLRRELDKERKITQDLKDKLEQLSNSQPVADTEEELKTSEETGELHARLSELERKLTFEQHRSDLWERLYLEAKEQKEDSGAKNYWEKQGQGKKSKETLFSTVQDTFDAVKNSTKEFVKHQKEKIKQAKEAVKENLKKFTDSVKSTFRHFKDSTRNLFNRNKGKKFGQKQQKTKKTMDDCHKSDECAQKYEKHHKADKQKDSWKFKHKISPFTQTNYKETGKHDTEDLQSSAQNENWKCSPGHSCSKQDDAYMKSQKGCSGVFECAHQESMSLFNKALDPIKADEFSQLLQAYVMQEVDNFHHWAELQKFISRFFHNGIFIHDQMLFTDFVNDVEDYLEDMKEYQKGSHDVFEDLDDYVYKHFFGEAYGPSQPYERPPFKQREGPRHRKHKWKQQSQPPYKKESKWSKPGRHGRQMANVEIKLGPMPFDPRY